MEPTLTKAELTAALKQWESEASSAEWQQRTDEARFSDTADYLFRLAGK